MTERLKRLKDCLDWTGQGLNNFNSPSDVIGPLYQVHDIQIKVEKHGKYFFILTEYGVESQKKWTKS